MDTDNEQETKKMTVGFGGQLGSVRDVARLLRISTRNVWRLTTADPRFPKPVRIGKRTVRWRWADIDRYLASL